MPPAEFMAMAPPKMQPWRAIERQDSPDRGADLLGDVAKMKRTWLNFAITDTELGPRRLAILALAGAEYAAVQPLDPDTPSASRHIIQELQRMRAIGGGAALRDQPAVTLRHLRPVKLKGLRTVPASLLRRSAH